MTGTAIFAICFVGYSVLFCGAAALDMLGEKGRTALWTELSKKLIKVFKKNSKE